MASPELRFEELQQLPVRDLLYLSQTDITPDPVDGFMYAASAYLVARTPEITEQDPTAAGEAAAKAGFRSAQAGMAPYVVDTWFMRSLDALPNCDPRTKREQAATYLLAGRAAALQMGRDELLGEPKDKRLLQKSRLAFFRAEALLADDRDPYATMLFGHQATMEAMDGDASYALHIAARGIKSALIARDENANTPDANLSLLERAKKMARFKVKHVGRSIIAATLAVTRPYEKRDFPQTVRRKIFLKSLG